MAAADRSERTGHATPPVRHAADSGDLSWLDDEEEFDDPAPRTFLSARMVMLLAAALTLLVIGGWWVQAQLSTPPAADGSTIPAPAEPYKVRPKDPGGITFDGSGDAAYLIGEGVEQRAVLADVGPPGDSALPTAAAAGAAVASAVQAEPDVGAGAASGAVVQVGAFATEPAAQAGWQSLIRRYEPLANHDHRVVEGRADIGNVYRLQAVTGSAGAASALCNDMRKHGVECQVKR
ncbi:SPOR domain-containing protein [Croceicoccus sp. F390]|uniref:SPOR domain-containing protein n=1 Tax=Croceicoccus esteveae TaxID=3075597 RepID=A0ABU2ZGH2_9SPHN|nr:SPOR domain-containing protein [Croceicoccus sp. F390]MDT0575683.1 SPOR domain-containing protein [Croceicoccus sp. F390]